MSSDFGYLFRLIRAYVDGAESPPEPPASLDWESFARIVLSRGLTTTVAELVANGPAPEQVKQTIESAARRLRLRTTLFWIETERILARLRESGIRSTLLKGPALGLTVYARPEHRLTADLDLLVARESVDAAATILADLGFLPATTLRHASFYEQHHFHRVLSNAAGVTVELHWDLSRPTDYFRFEIEPLVGRTRRLSRGGVEIHVPSDLDQLLHAACQALREGFTDLRRVVDASLLLPAGSRPPDGLAEIACRQGMGTALWALLHCRSVLLGLAPPDDLERALRPTAIVRRSLEGLLRPERNGFGERSRPSGLNQLMLWVCAPTPGAAADCVRRFLVPGPAEWLDEGIAPDAMPGIARRTAISARHTLSFAKLAAYQTWCVAAPDRKKGTRKKGTFPFMF